MDELRFYVSFNSISVISGRRKGEHEQTSAALVRKESRLQWDANPRTRDPKSGTLTVPPRLRFGTKRASEQLFQSKVTIKLTSNKLIKY